jgi:hypothetical protein
VAKKRAKRKRASRKVCETIKQTEPQLPADRWAKQWPGQPGAFPITIEESASPYHHLANVINNLYWLASCCRGDGRAFGPEFVNVVTRPWDSNEQAARAESVSRGVPFASFDPILVEARSMMDRLIAVAWGSANVEFYGMDLAYPLMERRLKELGATYAGHHSVLLDAPIVNASFDGVSVEVAENEPDSESAPQLSKRLTRDRFAKEIGVSVRTLYSRLKAGNYRYIKDGRFIQVYLEDLPPVSRAALGGTMRISATVGNLRQQPAIRE